MSLVYPLFAVHILHWKLTGRTLAPLELNEVMYTLELGIITAGFLFMAFLVLCTLIFGRFFCSWACHIIVLQDLCGYLLRKVGIRAKPIRSRMLLFIPPLTALYMFVWPQIMRTWHGGALPTFGLATDADGWGSFLTEHFWRNLPGLGITGLTFIVCGFAVIYLLGSRTFCTYVCPYGAVFALADRFAPGKIRLTGNCQQCGRCTAACTSGVRVHEEIRQHGMVVNPACLKDLDCVTVCPQGAIQYGFTRPALFRSYTSGGRFGLPYEFSIGEEAVIAVVFLVSLLSFRGLYGQVPFLLALTLGAILGYLAVVALRSLYRSRVSLARWVLKQNGAVTPSGFAYTAIAFLLGGLLMHSAFVRYHEYRGLKAASRVRTAQVARTRTDLLARAERYLTTVDRWGLFRNERVERAMAFVALNRNRPHDAEQFAVRFLQRHPADVEVRLHLAKALAAQNRDHEAEQQLRGILNALAAIGKDESPLAISAHHALGGLYGRRGDFAAAAAELRRAVAADPRRADVHADLGTALAELSDWPSAITHLREAVRLDPAAGKAHYNLGTLLGHQGRFDEAIPHYRQALDLIDPDADLHNNYGFALMRTAQVEAAGAQFQKALALSPDHAGAHFNLGVLLHSLGNKGEALHHLQTAARLDPQYARFLSGP